MNKIKFHPSEELLVGYASGDLNPALTVVVGTHIDMCPRCRSVAEDIQNHMATRELHQSAPLAEPDLNSMLEHIMASESPIVRSAKVHEQVSLEGKVFKVPRSLGRHVDRLGPWSHMPGGLWRAPLELDADSRMNLIYMQENASLPEHTHRGSEATLVLNGVFNDEHDEYRDGDFIFLDEHKHHSPQTTDEDCLTLAYLDAPLQFTSGLARLLNPFSSLFFR
ncbi:ChrR family anti-sigma-E factor [Aliidiomarina sanyensis]|uniref:ChrR family anti-sigma-E factor n=1 Tax=Aliidiomarina sanyensis TaxID=1249555 RepID=UPI001F5413BA|nr:ChrR family anti-sigma-E factor [Aliidiomarina sanyensis]